MHKLSHPPLVSIVIIFLDAEQFLEEAIKSVLAQTYDAWELLLVDDGSSDGSTEIARRYARANPRQLQYLEHEGHQNRGMSASRNRGIDQARGEFIAFLDADDVWLPHKLASQVEVLTAHPGVAMVYGPAQWWYSWTGTPEDRQRDFIHELGVTPGWVEPPDLLVRFLEAEGISPCTCSVLLRANAAREVGGFEPAFRGMYEDQVFFAKLCLAAPVWAMEDCSARYRQHASSGSSRVLQAGKHQAARLVYLRWVECYLSEQRVADASLRRVLNRALFPYRHPYLFRLRSRAGELARQLQRLLAKVLQRGPDSVRSNEDDRSYLL